MLHEGFHRESYYIDNFISGLKEEISQSLYSNKPQTLQEARNRARGQEHYLAVLDKRYRASQAASKSPSSLTSQIDVPLKYVGDKSTSTTKGSEGYRRLTLAEINERKAKGLCFHCDMKFEPGHNCRKKKIFVMMGNECEDSPINKELAIIWEDEISFPPEQGTEAKISLQAIRGSTGNCTLKL